MDKRLPLCNCRPYPPMSFGNARGLWISQFLVGVAFCKTPDLLTMKRFAGSAGIGISPDSIATGGRAALQRGAERPVSSEVLLEGQIEAATRTKLGCAHANPRAAAQFIDAI